MDKALEDIFEDDVKEDIKESNLKRLKDDIHRIVNKDYFKYIDYWDSEVVLKSGNYDIKDISLGLDKIIQFLNDNKIPYKTNKINIKNYERMGSIEIINSKIIIS